MTTARDVVTAALDRAGAATGGQWRLWGMEVRSGPIGNPDLEHSVPVATTHYRNANGLPRTNDATFIACAREDVPRLAQALLAVLDLADRHDTYADACERDVGLPNVGAHWRKEADDARDEANRIRLAITTALGVTE